MCSNCFANGKKYPHASKDCRKATKNAVPKRTTNCKSFQTRIIVNSSIKNAESVNWSQDWKFVSGVSFASVVKIPVTNNDSKEPKKSGLASVRGKTECSPKLVTNKYQGDSKCPYMDVNHVHKPENSKSVTLGSSQCVHQIWLGAYPRQIDLLCWTIVC